MTDLTLMALVTCFAREERQRLTKVIDSGIYEWVRDQAGNFFQATFADNCLRLTAMDDRNVVFHVTFEDVDKAVTYTGNLLELHNAG